jgi:cell division protein ZapA
VNGAAGIESGGPLKHRIAVSILGQSFTVASDDAPPHVERVAADVDARMRAFTTRDGTLSPFAAAVLAALNLASEYQKLREEHAEVERLIERLAARLTVESGR